MATIFIGNLAWGTTQDDLHAAVSAAGNVLSCELMFHADSGRSKGWGLATFSSPEEADNAISSLSGTYIGERPITLKLDRGGSSKPRGSSRRSNRDANEFILYIDNVADSVGWKDLKQSFAAYGCTFTNVKGSSSGPVGTVHFASLEDAQAAMGEMNGFDMHGQNISIRM